MSNMIKNYGIRAMIAESNNVDISKITVKHAYGNTWEVAIVDKKINVLMSITIQVDVKQLELS